MLPLDWGVMEGTEEDGGAVREGECAPWWVCARVTGDGSECSSMPCHCVIITPFHQSN